MAFAPPAHDLDADARLVVEVGAGVVPGQRTYVLCDVAHAPFARALTAAAYKAGAAYVDVLYQDQLQVKSHIEHAPFESLNYSPPWAVARFGELADSCAGIRVGGT